jgi:GNAT superfamily N-acetyltransferase
VSSSDNGLVIRPVTNADEPAWRRLWAGYLDFYESSLPQATTDRTWQRISGDDAEFGCIVAERDGKVLGIANYVLHPFTWSELPACLLHDLYVSPEARGHGAGRSLIQHLIDMAKVQNWARVYWVTQESNAAARTLYDRFRPADGFIRYSVMVE